MTLSHAPPHCPVSPVGRFGRALTLLTAIQASAASIDVGRHMITQFATCVVGVFVGVAARHSERMRCEAAHHGEKSLLHHRAARTSMLSMPLATSASPICVQLFISHHELTVYHVANAGQCQWSSPAGGDGHLPTLNAPVCCMLAQRQVLLLPRA